MNAGIMSSIPALSHGGMRLADGRAARDVADANARLDVLAAALDSAFRIPGTSIRVGADAALNLLPGIGTLAAKGIAGYLIWEARRAGVPTSTLLRMAANVGVDLAISAIPVVGWFGDIFFRANLRNIALLRAHLDRRAAAETGSRPARAPCR